MKYAVLGILGLTGLLCGCGSELETGYHPQKLGVADEERRAYYAPAFSPEAAAGASARTDELKARKPTP